MVKVKIVVSRCYENIEWTKQLPNVIIFNKGEDNIDEYNPIKLPNIGREGHTYYKYIYDNYDNLEDYTVFTQGHPFDHCGEQFVDNVKKIMQDPNYDKDLQYFSNISACNLCTGLSCDEHNYAHLIPVYRYLFGNITISQEPFIFGVGAIFIIRKDIILQNPREFYYKIYKMLEDSPNLKKGVQSDCIEGHIIERFHPLIFNVLVSNDGLGKRVLK